MSNVLVIKSSIRAEGNSSKLVDELMQTWANAHPEDNISHRDLLKSPLPHLSESAYMAMPVAIDQRTTEQETEMALSDELTQEFLAADTVIMGIPMYNFAIPSGFKAYIDHIARLGLTFRYTAQGPVGLAGDKEVIIVLARGGIYWETKNDTQTPYLKAILDFMGLNKIKFVVAEGLNISPEMYAKGMKSASADIKNLIAQD
jgi:FMN-dependent NADH-azoreductase